MEGSVGAPPQRVCPKCARISWATGPQCPYCTASFRRSGGVAPWMLAVAALVVLLGVGLMFYITVQEVNDRVDEVNSKIDTNFNRIRTDVQQQLDAFQAGAGAGAGTVPVPTVAPVPTEVPTVDPVTPEATETPTVEGETTPDPGAGATPTPEEPEIINP
ncbi:hypothetical protein OJ997_14655 [Solirubrobacter phytolaccae]|uniref:Uncharacterized protein n=1 Tax=Solirubrobacter phytolaccae TaxID=1404360 RepID=A0A9X3N884_9ACTN|nr:hypothetical protein [Solirubrobacter phytolaccae]MDA0181543.1 hypothetical protein [Solirubrobacter phytolaccae]